MTNLFGSWMYPPNRKNNPKHHRTRGPCGNESGFRMAVKKYEVFTRIRPDNAQYSDGPVPWVEKFQSGLHRKYRLPTRLTFASIFPLNNVGAEHSVKWSANILTEENLVSGSVQIE